MGAGGSPWSSASIGYSNLCVDESEALHWSIEPSFLDGDIAQIKHANYMTMTTNGHIMSWPDYLKTKGNMNIKLRDLCETLIVYILLSTF